MTELVADSEGNTIPTVRAYCQHCGHQWRTPAPVESSPYMVRCPACRHVVVIRSAA